MCSHPDRTVGCNEQGCQTRLLCYTLHSDMARPEKLDLKEYISSKEKKQSYANRLFETIASRYDFFTAFMSYGMDSGWKRTLVGMLKLGGDEAALDIACGTGDITLVI